MNSHSSSSDTKPSPIGVDHYENFPVASFLCPAHLRPAVQALYWFARVGDDIADEGDQPFDQRLNKIRRYQADLKAVLNQLAPSSEWESVFLQLAKVLKHYPINPQYLSDLLAAFEQDIIYTENSILYRNRQELLAYCRLSANPVGRLMLQMNHVQDPKAFQKSDEVCSGLQLINFWQDVSLDLARNRNYLPQDAIQGFNLVGVQPNFEELKIPHYHAQWASVIESEVQYAVGLLKSGRAVVHYLPRRMAWELRLVIEAALHVAGQIKAMQYQTFLARPYLKKYDYMVIAIKAVAVYLVDLFRKKT